MRRSCLAQRLQWASRVRIVNQQCEMVTLGMRMHGLIAFANEMQLLRGAELMPRAGKSKAGRGIGCTPARVHKIRSSSPHPACNAT